jgi:hypothetical protein
MATGGAGGSNQRNAKSPMRKPPIWASQATVASVTPSGAGMAPNRKLARNQKKRKLIAPRLESARVVGDDHSLINASLVA